MSRKPKLKKIRIPPLGIPEPRAREVARDDEGIPAAAADIPRSRPDATVAVCGFLLLAVIAIFAQTASYEFVNFDDPDYVYDNPGVKKGLTGAGIIWAFTAYHSANWHPLTWMSHQLDCQIYGLEPGGHHLTSLILHAANALVLFLALRRLTGAFWPSAWVAAVFAVHPLRVESVAWVTERKDVLSGLFFMTTLWFYARYSEQPRSWGRYVMVLLSAACGLMSKPMLVTLPFVLLLLDYWPLRRFPIDGGRWRLVAEKIPLFALAGISCLITLAAQQRAITDLGVSRRLAIAAVAYVSYLGKMVVPIDLAVLYPIPREALPAWEVVAAVVFLAAISAAVLLVRRTYPYLLVGWFWYLGMAAPIIGIVHVGNQSMADRYTYLTLIGPTMAIAFVAARFAAIRPRSVPGLAAIAMLVVAGLIYGAWEQTHYWRNSETLWRHTLACTTDNAVAHNNFGLCVSDEEAFGHYLQAVQINPSYPIANYNLGNCFSSRGKIDEAIACYRRSLGFDPNHAMCHANLGALVERQGLIAEAIDHYRKALALDPGLCGTRNNLGLALDRAGEFDEAIVQFRESLRIEPGQVPTLNHLGTALGHAKKFDEAVATFEQALAIEPQAVEVHNSLGLALADQGKFSEAIAHYQKALQIKPDCFAAQYNIGKALGRDRKDKEAIAAYQQALKMEPDNVPCLYSVATACTRIGQNDEAIAYYTKAVERQPDYVDAHFNLGVIMAARGRNDDARVHYAKALALAAARNETAKVAAIEQKINDLPR